MCKRNTLFIVRVGNNIKYGVRLQIYAVLIGYLLPKLLSIGQNKAHKLIDKLRYLQIEIGRHCTFIQLLGVEPMVG